MTASLLLALVASQLEPTLQPLPQVPATPPRDAPIAAPRRAPGGPLRVALPPAQVVGDVAARVLAAFEKWLTAEVGKYEGVLATGPDELVDVISKELNGRVRGCAQEAACLADVAGALGEDEILATEIVLDGTSYAVTVRRVPVQAGSSGRAETRKVKRGDGSELLALVGPVVQGLYPERGLKVGRVRGVEKEAFERLNPPPLPRWVFWTTAATAAVAAAGGVTYAVLAKDASDQYQALADESVNSPVSGATLVELQNQMDSRAKTANILFGVVAVFTVAAGVEYFFTDWHDYRASIQVLPASGGATLAVAGTF